jgi:putative CocE/NonD family hydrolase
MRYRKGKTTPELLRPDEPVEVTLDLGATSNLFRAGHRIRLEVSSSNFPRFDRNLNTGGNNYDESKGVIARNSVHHSKQYPSHITVTVVKGAVSSR